MSKPIAAVLLLIVVIQILCDNADASRRVLDGKDVKYIRRCRCQGLLGLRKKKCSLIPNNAEERNDLFKCLCKNFKICRSIPSITPL